MPRPSPLAATLAYYAQHATEFDLRTRSADLSALYDRFARLVPEGSLILDAGCGTGRDAAVFLARGYRVDAFDASPELVAIARRQGVPARVSTFRRMRARERYDAIWASASLLHLPRREIPIVLRIFARALKPGGVLFVSLKGGQGEGFQEDGRFFSLFSAEEFAHYLRAGRGFVIRDSWASNAPDSAGRKVTWLNFLAIRPKRQSARV